ncbi:MAG: hypothetical protein AAB508_01120 [Patescibacteria group bacterium]
MNKETTDRDMLLVSVFTFLTVSLWIFFELVKTTKTAVISTTEQFVITPITSKFDTQTMSNIKNRPLY